MNSTIIHDLPRYRVTSWGYGLAYELEERSTHKSIFFQGDEADAFRISLKDMTEGTPALEYDDALGVIWGDFAYDAFNYGLVCSPLATDDYLED